MASHGHPKTPKEGCRGQRLRKDQSPLITQGSHEAPSVLTVPVIGQVTSEAGVPTGTWIKYEWGVDEGGTKLKILTKEKRKRATRDRTIHAVQIKTECLQGRRQDTVRYSKLNVSLGK